MTYTTGRDACAVLRPQAPPMARRSNDAANTRRVTSTLLR
jgi:hypothetical protein